MICALCRQERELRCSHIIPKFVYTWLKESSGTGFLRFSPNPNQRTQDGLKKDFLCGDCEVLLSKFETEFANNIFYPLHKNEQLRLSDGPWFRYKSWCMKFAVSVSWRCLMVAREFGLKHFSETQRLLTDQALETWRGFILGKPKIPVHTSNTWSFWIEWLLILAMGCHRTSIVICFAPLNCNQ